VAYIGVKPTIGNFQICDAISVVNGQAAYTMQVGSVNVSPQSANHMIVSLNGVIQKPGSSYTVSGNTITFASNLATGDVIDFIQILGDVLDLGVPSDATVTTAKLVDNAITSAKVSDGVLKPPHRNIIINGDMSVAQRSTSTASITSGGYHTVDRFYTGVTTAGTWTQSQSTTVPSGQGFATSLKMDCTTADSSLAAGDLIQLVQYIEGQNVQYLKYGTSSAESLTLSFWVRSNKTGTYIAELRNTDNTRTRSLSYTISSADTWEKKTITFGGDTNSGPNNDNGEGLRLTFWLAAGSNYSSGTLATDWESTTQANRAVGQVNLADSTSNEWYITGIQLEVGTAASDFEFLPTDINLEKCYRYFQLINTGGVGKIIGTGGAYDNNVLLMSYTWVPKRTTPSLYQVSGTGYFYFYGSGSENDAFDLWKIYSPNYLHGLIYSDDSSISVSDNVLGWFQLNNSAAVLGLQAEL
jgi:hypothetical protein